MFAETADTNQFLGNLQEEQGKKGLLKSSSYLLWCTMHAINDYDAYVVLCLFEGTGVVSHTNTNVENKDMFKGLWNSAFKFL